MREENLMNTIKKEVSDMSIYDMLGELESVDNASEYGVEPLSYEVLGCGNDD